MVLVIRGLWVMWCQIQIPVSATLISLFLLTDDLFSTALVHQTELNTDKIVLGISGPLLAQKWTMEGTCTVKYLESYFMDVVHEYVKSSAKRA